MNILPQQHQLLIFRFLGHDVNPLTLNLSTDTTKSHPCLTNTVQKQSETQDTYEVVLSRGQNEMS